MYGKISEPPQTPYSLSSISEEKYVLKEKVTGSPEMLLGKMNGKQSPQWVVHDRP